MSTPPLTLDRAATALVLIDLQYGIVGQNVHPQPSGDVVARCKRLAQAFRAVNAPVVVVTVGSAGDGKDMLAPTADSPAPAAGARPANWSTVVDELDAQPTDLRIMKHQWGAFYGTELDLQLRRRGIARVVVGGLMTNFGVESTARDAYQHNYAVIVAEDACASFAADMHRFAIEKTLPRVGLVRSTGQIVAALR